MTTFDSREKSFENKFAHDQEKQFKMVARRRKLLGLWAASQMKISEEAAKQYATEIVVYGIEDKREGAVVNKIISDLAKHKVTVTEAEVRKAMEGFEEQASRDILAETK